MKGRGSTSRAPFTFALVLVLALAPGGCDGRSRDEISRDDAIRIALKHYARTKDLPHSGYEKPLSVTAEIDEVLADGDDVEERVWVVRMELRGGAETGRYVDPSSGEVYGGWSGSP